MRRRTFIASSAACAAASLVANRTMAGFEASELKEPIARGQKLKAPAHGKINVAFAVSPGANVMDIAGPWEVFQDVMIHGRGSSHDDMHPFRLYTVSGSTEPIRATGGLRILPDFAAGDEPDPDIIVVPALRGSPELHAWLRKKAPATDVTMSVCTGAFQLGQAGLLDGQAATTHHDFYDDFASRFEAVQLERDVRFVENEVIATAGGLTSGIDLALRVVERYFGRDVARATAQYMEHASDGWMV
ncbi:MAG: DJ-1/PfpI family protein [Xanthomonadales bacterium]|nr:DJ-1/PfpI family protein [Xanthomonadales bacterium]NNL95531.1 DJ-1/PfpI family protein [Xanthomonadales bacterium]